ncbi:protein LURP-one-related 11-like [Canna indica]|uniref:Protein LURP-one-related 11-like n=1 Tax=Canna indica TaxID=4628 RepID=A0AAQ3QGM2_9LILI|nr:protein LURP-one-related 11-like [Canna indica]
MPLSCRAPRSTAMSPAWTSRNSAGDTRLAATTISNGRALPDRRIREPRLDVPGTSIAHTSSATHVSSERECFTIWMKSLVLNGNGCTVYNSKGQVAYRVDNYDSKCCSKVYLMDLQGNLLLKILNKKLRVWGRWEGYRFNGVQQEEIKPWFRVRRPCGFCNAEHPICKVWSESGNLRFYQLMIDELESRSSSYKIVDIAQGAVLAEVRRKHTTSGIALGEDVFTLVVEPSINRSLIMGLVIIYGLMNRSL